MRHLFIASSLLMFFTACNKEKTDQTFNGTDVQLGSGKVYSFFIINPANEPVELGVEFAAGTLDNLPATQGDNQVHLDARAQQLTPFDHITLGWMPEGHPPAGLFDKPHFDTHFYLLTEDQQMQIPAATTTNMDLFAAPSAGYLPADYTIPFAIVPMMGKHWIDKNSTTFAGTTPFTHEFLYGTYKGRVAFVEPMITKAVLLSGAEVHQPMKQPSIFEKTGKWYPTRYNIYRAPGSQNVRISFDGFVLR
ncbi:MAG: hypothetical protein ACM3VS_14105 [Candidatus Dadabacteria bacterium]